MSGRVQTILFVRRMSRRQVNARLPFLREFNLLEFNLRLRTSREWILGVRHPLIFVYSEPETLLAKSERQQTLAVSHNYY